MEDHSSIQLPAKKEDLEKLKTFVLSFIEGSGVEEHQIWDIELILDEILMNIIKYAYPSEQGTIQINCCFDVQRCFTIEIIDCGIPFNPLDYPTPIITYDIKKVKTWGFGIFLVRNLIDNIAYHRKGNKNRLILIKECKC